MRDILFRAKKIDSGEWVEGYYLKAKNHWHKHKLNEDWIIISTTQEEGGWCSIYSKYPIDANTICQYTGLTDKNGNKIWENDVVKKHFYTDYDACANSEEYIGAVKFTDCAWIIETVRGKYLCTRPIFESMAYSEDVKHFEVLGNIFDNPELMGE